MRHEPAIPEGSRTRAAAGTFALRVFNTVAGLAASVAISRALLPEGRGVYSLAVTIASSAVVLGTWSLHRAVQYEWMRGNAPARLAGAGLTAAVLTGIPFAALAAAVAALVPATLAPGGLGVVWAALAAVPASIAVFHLVTFLNLHDRPQCAAAVGLLSGGAQAVALLVLAWRARLTPTAVTVVWSLAAVLALPAAVRAVRPLTGLARPGAELVRRLLRRGGHYHAGHLANHLLLRADIFVVGALLGTSAVGLYSLAVAVAESLLLATGSIAVAGLGTQARHTRGDAYTAKLTRTTCAAGMLLALAAAASAWVVVPVVFGAAFAPAVPALLVLLPGVVALGAREPLELFVVRADRPLLASAIGVGALVANLGLNLLLVPAFGIVGAALASTVVYVAHFAALALWFLHGSGLRARALRTRASDLIGPAGALLRMVRSARPKRPPVPVASQEGD